MKSFQKYILLASSFAFLFTACSKEQALTPVSKGNADFSKYVALGNSLTAGYADNALYYAGQKVSYPNLLAQQFKQVGGGEFKQPLIDPNSVGIGGGLNAKLILRMVNGALAPVPAAPMGDLTIFTNSVASQGPFNNMGVPGAKLTNSVMPGYGNAANGLGNYNPFFTRMTTQPTTASMLLDAVAQQASFFSVFLGNNDLLGYATGGGVGDVITPMAGPAGVGFELSYKKVLDEMMNQGAKGVLINLPDVTSAPFFTTIAYNGLVLTRQGQVDSLNFAYAPLIAGGLVQQFQVGANGFIIADTGVPGGRRQMKAGELVLLSTPQDSLRNAGWGSIKPLADQYVLNKTEVGNITIAKNSFNQKIKSFADERDLAYVDIDRFLQNAKTHGIELNGRNFTTTFVTGGIFSLDGIHLTPIGNVFLANEVIKAVNTKYNAFIPQVDPSKFGGVKFP
ncbi:MAG TPA: hypothetical protein VLZ83_14990 [Edaphocola sp.]|nr:hypothetical protein [Edaphocola sp.]